MDDLMQNLIDHDPDLIDLPCGDGGILVSPGLQGRIFAHLGGELVHRLDVERTQRPAAGEFNNLGGNSLWPAPEGGPLAFNYLPGSDEWVVQPGIADVACEIVEHGGQHALIEKTIALTNRKGTDVQVRFRRHVEVVDAREGDPHPAGKSRRALAYRSEDTLEPLGDVARGDVLLAAWSLEQFPGGEDVTAFACMAKPREAINFDFYGMPAQPPVFGERCFTLALGGTAKFQIGVTVNSRPTLLGALDRRRSLLMLRHTEAGDGLYFNIADNDQPDGPFAAADMYSVFNGGDLDFFELETIAPMMEHDGRVTGSRLVSTTWFYEDEIETLERAVTRLTAPH